MPSPDINFTTNAYRKQDKRHDRAGFSEPLSDSHDIWTVELDSHADASDGQD